MLTQLPSERISASRRAALAHAALALFVPRIGLAAVSTSLPSADLSAASSPSSSPLGLADAPEAALSMSAGLAQVVAEIELTSRLIEERAYAQLRGRLRSPLFAAFLGFSADAPRDDRRGARQTDEEIEGQLAFVLKFPSASRLQAAATLSRLLSDFREIDDLAFSALSASNLQRDSNLTAQQGAQQLVDAMLVVIADARTLTQEMSNQYYADGCVACTGQPVFGRQTDAYSARIAKFEPRINRRPDSRDEKLAKKLGFRDGELIGGY